MSFFNGTLSLLTAFMWEMNVGEGFGMFEWETKLGKSFLFATSLIELSVLLSHGGQVFFADVSSISVARNWCVRFYKRGQVFKENNGLVKMFLLDFYIRLPHGRVWSELIQVLALWYVLHRWCVRFFQSVWLCWVSLGKRNNCHRVLFLTGKKLF